MAQAIFGQYSYNSISGRNKLRANLLGQQLGAALLSHQVSLMGIIIQYCCGVILFVQWCVQVNIRLAIQIIMQQLQHLYTNRCIGDFNAGTDAFWLKTLVILTRSGKLTFTSTGMKSEQMELGNKLGWSFPTGTGTTNGDPNISVLPEIIRLHLTLNGEYSFTLWY